MKHSWSWRLEREIRKLFHFHSPVTNLPSQPKTQFPFEIWVKYLHSKLHSHRYFHCKFQSHPPKPNRISFLALDCAPADPDSELSKNFCSSLPFLQKMMQFSKFWSREQFCYFTKINLSLKTHKTQNAVNTRNPIRLKLFFGCSVAQL